MASVEEIKNQRDRLEIHRGNLAHYITQHAKAGSAYAQAGLANNIRDERKEIARIKSILRKWEVEAEDHPDDDPDHLFMYENDQTTYRSVNPTQSAPHNGNAQTEPTLEKRIGARSRSDARRLIITTQGRKHKPSASIEEITEAPTIGIITALTKETVAFKAVLNNIEEYNAPGRGAGRRYIIGTISARSGGHHRIVVTQAGMGNNQAAGRGMLLLERFPSVSAIIMVGIAGGVPHPQQAADHVRLGDIVVSSQYGIVQYDFVKADIERDKLRPYPRPPSAILLESVDMLEEMRMEGVQLWKPHIDHAIMKLGEKWNRPPAKSDILKDINGIIIRHPPDDQRMAKTPHIFLGPIASANTLLKNPVTRDRLRDMFHVKAVEMEASGVADATWNFEVGYLVVRGICDYCDSSKNDIWQNYASIIAASYARALLECLPPKDSTSHTSKGSYNLPQASNSGSEGQTAVVSIDNTPGEENTADFPDITWQPNFTNRFLNILEEKLRMNDVYWDELGVEGPLAHEYAVAKYFYLQMSGIESLCIDAQRHEKVIKGANRINEQIISDIASIIRDTQQKSRSIANIMGSIPDHPLYITIVESAAYAEACTLKVRENVLKNQRIDTIIIAIHSLSAALQELDTQLRRMQQQVADELSRILGKEQFEEYISQYTNQPHRNN